MPALTDLTIAGALAGLAKGEYSSRELTAAHLSAMEAGRALNAFVTETPERALEIGERFQRQAQQGRGRPAGRHPARHQGSLLHRGRADHGRLAHPGRLRPAL